MAYSLLSREVFLCELHAVRVLQIGWNPPTFYTRMNFSCLKRSVRRICLIRQGSWGSRTRKERVSSECFFWHWTDNWLGILHGIHTVLATQPSMTSTSSTRLIGRGGQLLHQPHILSLGWKWQISLPTNHHVLNLHTQYFTQISPKVLKTTRSP